MNLIDMYNKALILEGLTVSLGDSEFFCLYFPFFNSYDVALLTFDPTNISHILLLLCLWTKSKKLSVKLFMACKYI